MFYFKYSVREIPGFDPDSGSDLFTSRTDCQDVQILEHVLLPLLNKIEDRLAAFSARSGLRGIVDLINRDGPNEKDTPGAFVHVPKGEIEHGTFVIYFDADGEIKDGDYANRNQRKN